MIEVATLHPDHLPRLAELYTRQQNDVSCPLLAQEVTDSILLHGGEPRAILAIDPQGWLTARSAAGVVGFIHCTVGRLHGDDPETLRGFVRALVLAADAQPAVAQVLLRAANAYFASKRNLANIIAFHPDGGYPRLDFGRGALAHERWGVMDALGDAGYHLSQRWLFYERPLPDFIPEQLPQLPGLTLQWQDIDPDNFVLTAWSGLDKAAQAHFMTLPQPPSCSKPRTASIYRMEVRDSFQHQGIGRWLLQRGANHLRTIGVERLMETVSHQDVRTQDRLRRLGFHECPQRGYTATKPAP